MRPPARVCFESQALSSSCDLALCMRRSDIIPHRMRSQDDYVFSTCARCCKCAFAASGADIDAYNYYYYTTDQDVWSGWLPVPNSPGEMQVEQVRTFADGSSNVREILKLTFREPGSSAAS
eukprot:7829620-Pyramimonas_sp.AAC.1